MARKDLGESPPSPQGLFLTLENKQCLGTTGHKLLVKSTLLFLNGPSDQGALHMLGWKIAGVAIGAMLGGAGVRAVFRNNKREKLEMQVKKLMRTNEDFQYKMAEYVEQFNVRMERQLRRTQGNLSERELQIKLKARQIETKGDMFRVLEDNTAFHDLVVALIKQTKLEESRIRRTLFSRIDESGAAMPHGSGEIIESSPSQGLVHRVMADPKTAHIDVSHD